MRILTAITTYGSAPYIDLSLSFLKNYSQSDYIVVDDCSKSEELAAVCNKYNVPLIVSDKRCRPFNAGDFHSIGLALKYAKDNGYDYILKLSRRWIWMENPFPNLLDIIEKTEPFAVGNRQDIDFAFRTNCMLLSVSAFSAYIPEIIDIGWRGDNIVPEWWFYSKIENMKWDNVKYQDWMNTHPKDKNIKYVIWEDVGDTKNTPPYILNHFQYSYEDYYKTAVSRGLCWDKEAFNIKPSHLE